MSVPNLLKRDNIDTFINMINGGTPFQLSAKWLGKTDVDDTLKDSLVVIEKVQHKGVVSKDKEV